MNHTSVEKQIEILQPVTSIDESATLSLEENARRAKAFAYIKASIESEGFTIPKAVEDEVQRYIAGEIDVSELSKFVCPNYKPQSFHGSTSGFPMSPERLRLLQYLKNGEATFEEYLTQALQELSTIHKPIIFSPLPANTP